jgi:hypothetical protein
MAPQYGEVRVDYITYTTGVVPNEGTATAYVSGLINNPTFSGNVIIEGDATIDGNLNVSGDINASGVVISGITGLFDAGTEALPSIAFALDPNTGIYNPSANEVGISTDGNERLRVDNTGNVGIGTTNPLRPLDISTSANRVVIFRSTTATANIELQDLTTTTTLAIGKTGDDLFLYSDDVKRLTVLSGGNVGIGTANPLAKLDVNGDALINTLTVGLGSGSVSTNTAVGRNALQGNTTGQFNTAVGQNALLNNTTGEFNTAVGRSTLLNNTTGTNNTAVGQDTLNDNTTGNSNTAIGRSALIVNTEGSENISIGRNALNTNTTGSGNIGIGGRNSAGTYAPVFNPTTESNRIVMGSTSVTNAYVQVAWTVTSDARDKTNFASVPYGLDFVKQLEPTAYQFKAGTRGLRDPETNELIPVTAADELPSGPVRYGFKAQDILALEGDNPVIIDNEDPDHLRYRGEALVPVLVNAIKEQQVLIDALTARLDAAGIA